MERNQVIELMKELKDKYGNSRNNFSTDDYYKILRYIPVDRIDDIKRTVIEDCVYFPKPADIKKISYQFKTEKVVGVDEKDDVTKCVYQSCRADLRQFPSDSPYMCTGCYKSYMDNVEVVDKQYKTSGIVTGSYLDDGFGSYSKDLPI